MNKWFLGRGSMIGDITSALCVATYIKKYADNPYIVFAIGKKCASVAPLLINHPDINELYVCDGLEGVESKKDWEKFNSCKNKLNINPPHPDNLYPSQRNIYHESFLMQLPNERWDYLTAEEQTPKLVKWWQPVKRPFGDKKTVFVVGSPNFGKESKRAVSWKYLEELVLKLVELGYCVIQSGGEQDPAWFSDWDISEGFPVDRTNYKRVNELSFFQQIQIANECDLVLGNDSGMSLVCGAYLLPMVSMLTLHWGNTNNPSALSTNNPNNYSFYSFNGTDDINQDSVLDMIKKKCSI